MHGQFVWYELTTPDAAAAQKFYPRFTGWGTQSYDKDYTMFTTGGVPIAGIFRLNDEMRQQGVPPNWMPYVDSTNVDETAQKAASLGGKVVVPPTDIPGTGRFAVVQDPQGATFGIYKSSVAQGGWDGTPVVGRFSWHELMTTDAAAATAFYGALFGWDKSGEMDMGGGNMYYMFGKGAKMYGGIYNRMPEMAGMPPAWLVYIHVKDVGKAVATATKAGATVVRPRMDIPGGTIAILADPQGAGIAVHDVAIPAAAAEPAAKKAATAVKKAATVVKKAAKKVVKKAKKAVKKAAKKVAKARPKAKKVAKARPKAKKAAKARPKAKNAAKARPKAKKAAKARPKAKSRPKAKGRAAGKKKAAPKRPAARSRGTGRAAGKK